MGKIIKSYDLIRSYCDLTLMEYRVLNYIVIHKNGNGYCAFPILRFTQDFLNYKGSPKYSEIKEIVEGFTKKYFITFDNKKIPIIKDYKYLKGKGTINIEVSPELIQHTTYSEDMNFIVLEYEVINKFKSKLSVRLYEFIKTCGSNKVYFSLEELRYIFKLPNSYVEITNFNRKVLVKAIKEINQVSDIEILYSPVRKSRNIIGFNFDISDRSNSKQTTKKEDMTFLFHYLSYEFDKKNIVLNKDTFLNWLRISELVWKEKGRIELTKTITTILTDNEIEQPIAYINFLLSSKLNCIENNINPIKIFKI